MRTLCLAISLCLLSAPLTAQNGTSTRTAPPKVLSDGVEYQIYSEMLANFFRQEEDSAGKTSVPILISDHTPAQAGTAKSAVQKSINDEWLLERFDDAPKESLQKETLEDYEKNRAAEVSLGAKFSPELQVVLLPDAVLAPVISESSGGLPEAYSQGIVTLSRIGFNPQRSQALVSMDYFCGPFCSAEEMYLLLKSGSGWKVENKIQTSEASNADSE